MGLDFNCYLLLQSLHQFASSDWILHIFILKISHMFSNCRATKSYRYLHDMFLDFVYPTFLCLALSHPSVVLCLQTKSSSSPAFINKVLLEHTIIFAWKLLQRSLVGYSPWSCNESDTPEQLSTEQHDNL